jgi:hypothetical protein
MAASGETTMTAPRPSTTNVFIIEVLQKDWLSSTVENIRTLACGHELAMNAASAHVHAAVHMQLLPGDESAER